MNHDACHCSDYDKKTCPPDCYRAKLTEELNVKKELWGIPMSFSKLRNTPECPLNETYEDKRRTNGERIRQMTDFELASKLATTSLCPSEKRRAYCKKKDCLTCWKTYLAEVEDG